MADGSGSPDDPDQLDPDQLDPDQLDPDQLDAGPFGPWLAAMRSALSGGPVTDVPCGSCVACCSSRQFVHVEPDELDTLAHLPRELTFPAPGSPPGYVVLPYDAAGRCPMLGDHGCSIYEHRPRTCRVYDCRVFTAAGIEPDADQPAIRDRVARWRFTTSADDRVLLDAVRATAEVLARPEAHPDGRAPSRASQRAAMAVALHDLAQIDATAGVTPPTAGAVRVALSRRRAD